MKNIRLGLCGSFYQYPIKFYHKTASSIKNKKRDEQLQEISAIALYNTEKILDTLKYCLKNEIFAYRVLSQIFPLFTHPEVGYELNDLPDYEAILGLFEEIRNFRRENGIRLSLHPDQFNVLTSPKTEVIMKTVEELEYQGKLAELLDAEAINIHVGGVYGDKQEAMKRFLKNFNLLSQKVKSRMTLENDDVSYSPSEVVELCKNLKIPFVYDVHHHRCLKDNWDIQKATQECLMSWETLNREPWFHISSPKGGWNGANKRIHADFVDFGDFPECWKDLEATVDVEARTKELAVMKLKKDLKQICQGEVSINYL